MTRHPILAVLLAILLAVGTTLSGAAMARHTVTVELCSDGALVTVTLDTGGHPVAPHRPCPLCLAAQDMDLPPAPATWSRPATAARAVHAGPAAIAPVAPDTPAAARGPPLTV